MKKTPPKIKKQEKIYQKTIKSAKQKKFLYSILAISAIIASLFLTIYAINQQQELRSRALSQGLHVQGNKLVDGQGQQVLLHGVDRSGAEFDCVGGSVFDGPTDAASIQAMRTWNINAVRVPLNEDCWLGINGVKTGGQTYQQAIKNFVTTLNQQGMYVILDLHWNAPGGTKATGQTNMADSDHSPAFWASVANTFKGNSTVIFDLYNEPHDISWSCWKDSGSGNCGTVAGMQQMINAVRATGATNVIMAGGLGWASDLSGWLANKPTDPAGNLVASWHMYGNSGCEGSGICWNTTLMANIINQAPVIVGEFGESSNGSVCGTNIINTFMNWLDQHQTSYIAWTWNTWGGGCGALTLINDYNGTPKSPNGVAIKNHYLSLAGQSPTVLPSPSSPASGISPTPTVIITPPFNCLGSCPTATPAPTNAVQSPSPIPSTSASPGVIQPSLPVSTQPSTSVTQAPRGNPNGRNNGSFIQLFLQFIQLLLQLLMGLFGGRSGNN